MALDPLATVDDFTVRAGRTFSADELPRIEALLRDASAAVRRYTRQKLTLSESTVKVNPRGRKTIRLAQKPVVTVDSVVDINGTAIAHLWDGVDLVVDGLGHVVVNGASFWRSGAITVTYTHGYEEIPDDIIAVVCNVALRAFGTKPTDGAMTGESVQGYSYTMGAIGAAGPVGLLPEEKTTLDDYRVVGATVFMGAP